MGKTNEAGRLDDENKGLVLNHEHTSSHRLNLNDLLKRRKEEKNLDKKNNLAILTGAAAVAAVVIITILSL